MMTTPQKLVSLLLLGVAAALSFLPGASARATASTGIPALISSKPDTTYVTDGPVHAITRVGNTIYLGGQFSEVGPRTGPSVAIDATTGTVAGLLPQVSGGQVRAVAGDGSGGWYIGGDFTHVGGLARNWLAHVLANGSVDATFNPNPSGAYGAVYALMYFGGTLYVGGDFTSIGGQTRHELAQLDSSGNATSFNPAPDSTVHALAAHSGTATHPSTLFVGGDFTAIGGQSRLGLAELDLSGNTLSWNPGDGGEVDALAVTGYGLAPLHVYAGGQFTSVADQPISYLAEIDATGAAVTSFNANVSVSSLSPSVDAIAVSGSTLYVGGRFTSLGGQSRRYIGAVDSTNGAATSWNANADAPVDSLALSGNALYAGGDFTQIGGASRNHLAAIDATNGVATAWNPDANNRVEALAVSGTDVYAGGVFSSIGGTARSNLAAISAATGAPTAWDPGANGVVNALAVANGIVYAGGQFQTAGGTYRSNLAAIDATTGGATAWSPGASNPSDYVLSLAVSGAIVYVGGYFSSIGGQSRNSIAALDRTTGAVTAWNPSAPGLVNAISVSGGTVYVGGSFYTIGGATRHNLAALDSTTGKATAWNPAPNAGVQALAISGSTVYVGGGFTQVGSYLRNGLAAIATNGSVDPWNPRATNSPVNALAVSGSTVYAAGSFSGVGATARRGLAAINASTGLATSWDPSGYGPSALAVYRDGSVYVGGSFRTFDLAAQQGFASFSVLPASKKPPALSAGVQVLKPASCSKGAWLGSTPQSYTYAWLQDGVAISGATSPKYTPTLATGGHKLSCRVTATNLGGSTSAVSKAVSPLACVVPAVTGKSSTAAKGAIVAAHCSVGAVTSAHSPQTKGSVIGEKPVAHRVLPVGGKVALVVSLGP
jgi:hypothetical protein